MFEVINKSTGKRVSVLAVAVDGEYLITPSDDGESFEVGTWDKFKPVPEGYTRQTAIEPEEATKPVTTVLTTHHAETLDLDDTLTKIKTGELTVCVGDSLAITLKDGTEVELVVTDQGDGVVRLESRDCLGINTSATELDAYLDKVYDLLPDALQKHIKETTRIYLRDGSRFAKTHKLFVPSVSEIFPPDECYGDENVYEQLEWYKDVHHRVRADRKGGNSHWYWTGSPYSGNSDRFCCVTSNGNATHDSAINTNGLAPFGCIISKIS